MHPKRRGNAERRQTKNRAQEHAAAGNHELPRNHQQPKTQQRCDGHADRHGYARQIQPMLLLQLSLKDIRKRVDHLRSDNQQKRRKLFAAATVAMPYTHVHNIMSAQEMMRLTTYSPIE